MFPLCILVMVLCLQFGGLCNAVPVVVILNLEVEFGEPAILPCNGSAYLEENGPVQWEAMGEEVAILRGGELREGDRFMGRIQLPSEEKVREGDWSVVLQSTVLSDSDMYECILEGRKTLSTVWLTVTAPQVERSLVVPVGDQVILECYIKISRRESQNELQVWWTKDGNTVITGQTQGSASDDMVSYPEDLSRMFIICDAQEKCNLHMSPALMSDNGEYHCLYKARHSEDPRPGIPESITLTVLDKNPTDNVFHPIPVHLEDPTQPIIESQPMEVFEEVVTSFPDEGMKEISLQWDTLPWIRIGLITGVLLVTAMVLCILVALRKI